MKNYLLGSQNTWLSAPLLERQNMLKCTPWSQNMPECLIGATVVKRYHLENQDTCWNALSAVKQVLNSPLFGVKLVLKCPLRKFSFGQKMKNTSLVEPNDIHSALLVGAKLELKLVLVMRDRCSRTLFGVKVPSSEPKLVLNGLLGSQNTCYSVLLDGKPNWVYRFVWLQHNKLPYWRQNTSLNAM